jgi:cysteine-rich repeat protein
MRRSFVIALASLTFASISVGLTTPGCGPAALDVQDLCGWIADECNCYRRFAAGVNVATDAEGNQTLAPKCGIALDSANNALDPVTGAVIEDETTKSTWGSFSARDKLDICVRPQGGQVVFDGLDLAGFPFASFSFKILDASGDVCATGSYGSITNFSIGFPAPEGAGNAGSGGAGGGGGAGGDAPSPQELCYDNNDPGQNPIADGTFSMQPGGADQIVETSCPNDEPHRFNLYQLNKCDGSEGEGAYKALLPTAEIEADAGAANIDGYIRFRVFWPPTAAGLDLNGQKPLAVEYFHCLIPGASLPCFDGAFSDGETDVDCGGTCPVNCEDGKDCKVGSDCISQVCETNDMGFLKCVSPPCGDLDVSGLETCDDGNTAGGDGCSATCQAEPGFTCSGPGACVDTDECAEGTDNCPMGTACENLPGTFTCDCDPGFTYDAAAMECVAGCGDGDKKNPPEACDDANVADGDGCTEN